MSVHFKTLLPNATGFATSDVRERGVFLRAAIVAD